MKLIFFALSFVLCCQCFSQSYISRQKAIADMDYYNKTLLEVHVNPFLFITKENYFAEIEAIKKSIRDSVSSVDFLLILFNITALIKDGHNYPHQGQVFLKDDFDKAQFFPYSLVIEGYKAYVPKSTAVASGIPLGASIISINTKKLNTLIPRIEKCFGANKKFAESISSKLFCYFLFLYDVKPPFTIAYMDSAKQMHETVLSKGSKLMDVLTVTVPLTETNYSFKMIDHKLGYIDFTGMAGYLDVFDHFLDSCFTLIKKNNIKYVAIDLRKNGGGNSALGNVLISHFSKKKYLMATRRKWRISPKYKEYLMANGDTTKEYLKEPNGTLWERYDSLPKENEFKNDIYTGKVYFITGSFTYSSANMLADGVKQYKIAEIIGEPTGENTNDFAEAFDMILPNSKIKIQTTSAFDIGANGNSKNYAPVMPDKIIKPRLYDRIYEKDKALEYILSQVK
jgi:hypothetical protein